MPGKLAATSRPTPSRTAARASEVATALVGLGYAVSAQACNGMGAVERRRLADAVRKTPCALVLWSHAATPSLRRAADIARRTERLALARLDTQPAPARLGTNAISLNRGRMQANALRRLVENATMTSDDLQPLATRTSRLAAVFSAVALSLVAASAAYFVNPAWAARVDAVAANTQSQVLALLHSVTR